MLIEKFVRVSWSRILCSLFVCCFWRSRAGHVGNKVSEGAAIATQRYVQRSGDLCAVAMLVGGLIKDKN